MLQAWDTGRIPEFSEVIQSCGWSWIRRKDNELCIHWIWEDSKTSKKEIFEIADGKQETEDKGIYESQNRGDSKA